MKLRINPRSVEFRVTIRVGGCLLVLGALLICYAGYISRRDAVEKARFHMQEVTQLQAQLIRIRFETAMSAARTMAQSLTAFKSSGAGLTRTQVNAMLRRVLEDNPDFLGVAVCWEPDAFDGKDSLYRLAPGHDGTGRFVPYWNRGPGGNISLDACLGYDTPGIGDYYLIPRRTMREAMIEPYIYPVQGEDTYMTSMVVPVIVGGRFLGMADVDYALNFLQRLADDVNLYERAGKLYLLTPGGMIASATGMPEFVGRPASDASGLAGYASAAERDRRGIVSFKGNLYASCPIPVGRTETPWRAVLKVPERVITAEPNMHIAVMIAGALLFASLGIAGVMLLLRQTLLGRFRILSAAAAAFASGRFETRCELPGGDEISFLGESFNAMASRVEALVSELSRSELFLKSVIDSTGDLIFTVDPDEYRILSFNEGLRKYFSLAGRTLEKGMGLEDIFDMPEVGNIWRGYYRRLADEGDFTVEHRMSFGTMTVSLSFRRIILKGELIAIAVYGRDITAQKKAEEALAASEAKYRLIVENAPIGIFQRTLDGDRIDYANPELLRQHGCPGIDEFNAVYGDPIRRWGDPVRYERYRNQLQHDHQVSGHELELRMRDSGTKWISVFAFYEAASDLVNGFTVDITELKQAAEEHGRLLDQLHHSQKMDSIGQLAGGVAHDFNNILGGIIGAAELLSDPSLPAARRESYIAMITSAAKRASELTGKLLAVSRKGHKMSTAVDAAKIVEDTIEILRRTIDKRIVISCENPGGQLPVIGDDGLLQSVFMNIGINASHAMPDGGTLTFRLSAEVLDEVYCSALPYRIEPGPYACIEIRDTGCGMSPEILGRIFEPFFTTKEKGKGTGLGLAAAYGTVRDHGGAINVYSEPGQGSSFSIYLPLTSEAVAAPAGDRESVSGSGTILLIDDDEIIRLTASRMLESLGYQVLAASNGMEGIGIFEREHERIGLVIVDMIMPVMDGRDAFLRIRKISPSAKVIISSGFSKDSDLAEMKKAGLIGLIRKPFRKTELSRIVAEAISSPDERV